MRLRERLDRLFMDPYQRALIDPRQYRAEVDPQAIIADIKSGRSGIRDYETKQFMTSAVEDEVHARGKLTLEGIAHQIESLDRALHEFHPECLHEFGVTARLGAEMLADYLVRRANQIAEGIKGGATESLAGAFGPQQEARA